MPASTQMMKAAVVHAFGQPLGIEELPIPEPGRRQILVKTEACGVCHTDLHAADGDWPIRPKPPFVPGHEGVGTVIAVGDGVQEFRVGDRAGIPWLFSACGECEWCVTGWETLCPHAQYGGYTVNGGFAEYFVADSRYAAHIPPTLPSITAAPLLCAGLTVYKGLRETEARPGEWVAIVGIGGLGHLALEYAKAMGLRTIAVDTYEEKLDLARQMGVDMTVNAAATEPSEEIRKRVGGAHGVLITAPSLHAFRSGVESARPRGTCVLVGLPPGEFSLPIFDVVLKRLTIRGSLVGTRADMHEALTLAVTHRIAAHFEREPLENINDIFERLREGRVQGRVVLDFFGKVPDLVLRGASEVVAVPG